MATMAAKFRVWCEAEAEKAEAGKDEDAKPEAFLASGLTSGKGARGHLLPLSPQCKPQDIGMPEVRGHLSKGL